MHRTVVILFLLSLATGLTAQQSNKSKSKDRYREKDQLSPAEVAEAIDRYGALRALAEREFRPTVFALSEMMLNDRASAPVASRSLAYALLAGYETTARYQSRVASLHDVLRSMPMMLSFTPTDSVFYPFASLYAILETGRQLSPSGYLLAQKQAALEMTFRQNGLQEAYIKHSKAAAADISRLILDYSYTDGYARLNSYTPFQPPNAPGVWNAAGSMPLDPYWGYLRPFFLESAQQFANPAPTPFDGNAGSPFMAYAREVYELSRNLVPEQHAVAYFWACDPAALPQSGLSRITPAGRWLNIAGLVCEQQRVSFIGTLKVHTLLALSMADAVIACWDEKYRHLRVRPQTAINLSFDPNWRPLLAAPACPAGPSLQSAVSAAAAEVMSRLLGENIPLVDNTEAGFGVPARQYPSVRLAAEEAAWSRLFAGVQFRDGILTGQETGRKIGSWALSRWPVGQ